MNTIFAQARTESGLISGAGNSGRHNSALVRALEPIRCGNKGAVAYDKRTHRGGTQEEGTMSDPHLLNDRLVE